MPDWRTLALIVWCALAGLAVALAFGAMIWVNGPFERIAWPW